MRVFNLQIDWEAYQEPFTKRYLWKPPHIRVGRFVFVFCGDIPSLNKYSVFLSKATHIFWRIWRLDNV